MGHAGDSAVLAVDAGGSTCRVAVQIGARRMVRRLGPANATTDFAGTVAVIRAGLADLAADSGLGGGLYALPAWVGVAGVLDAQDGARLAVALPLAQAHVTDDRPAAVRGALGARDGALAGLGTGSFLARQSGGQIRLAGGWGARLGDEASGHWIARRALALTLDVVDGLRAPSPLADLLMAECGGHPAAVVRYAAQPPDRIAALAPLVLTAAGQGDALAAQIMSEAGDYLARVLGGLGWHPGERLCLLGGVAAGLRPFLPCPLATALVPPVGSALDGAVALARGLPCREAAP